MLRRVKKFESGHYGRGRKEWEGRESLLQSRPSRWWSRLKSLLLATAAAQSGRRVQTYSNTTPTCGRTKRRRFYGKSTTTSQLQAHSQVRNLLVSLHDTISRLAFRCPVHRLQRGYGQMSQATMRHPRSHTQKALRGWRMETSSSSLEKPPSGSFEAFSRSTRQSLRTCL